MYAMLGKVRFELVGSFTGLETEYSAHFAKHDVLKGKPRLQSFNNDLTSIRFSLKLHWRLGNPDTAYHGLLTALASQQAVSLVYGSGRFVGWFVLEKLNERTLIQDAQGRTAAREVDVELTEFIGDPNNPLPTPAVMAEGQNPLLSLLPESVRAQASKVMQAVETGVKIYRAAETGINNIQNLIQVAKDIKHDPIAALHLLGDALNSSSSILANLNSLPEVTKVIGHLAGAAEFAAQAGQATNQLGNAVDSLRSGIESHSLGDWVDTASGIVAATAASLSDGAAAVQSLTGWLATRKDTV